MLHVQPFLWTRNFTIVKYVRRIALSDWSVALRCEWASCDWLIDPTHAWLLSRHREEYLLTPWAWGKCKSGTLFREGGHLYPLSSFSAAGSIDFDHCYRTKSSSIHALAYNSLYHNIVTATIRLYSQHTSFTDRIGLLSRIQRILTTILCSQL